MNYSQYIPFLVKSLIAGAIATALGLFLITVAINEATRSFSRVAEDSISHIKNQIAMPNYSLGQGKLSAGGERLVYGLKEMSPERRKELIALLREIVVELRPFAIELWPLWPLFMNPHTADNESLAPEKSQ